MKQFRQKELGAYFIVLFISAMCISCEEVFSYRSDEFSGGIAFDGKITNQPPPYFFRITSVAPFGELDNEGIAGAIVVITDETAGIRDTLKELEPIVDGGNQGYVYYDYHAQKMEDYWFIVKPRNQLGVHVTTKIYGIEGHTYSLDIEYKGEHYTARETMVSSTPITNFKIKIIDLGPKGKSAAPCISFVNRPNEDNYYLFYYYPYSVNTYNVHYIAHLFDAHDNWNYTLLSDEHLEENVVDYVVSEGMLLRGMMPGIGYPSMHDSIYIYMYSLSSSCYVGYGDMIKQVATDGGAYSPAPSNIRGNISGNIFGLFQVSAISERGIYVGNRN